MSLIPVRSANSYVSRSRNERVRKVPCHALPTCRFAQSCIGAGDLQLGAAEASAQLVCAAGAVCRRGEAEREGTRTACTFVRMPKSTHTDRRAFFP
eukprot:5233808-Pleurochrysis_carterae.AAC.2